MPDGTASATAVPQFTANMDYQRVHPVTTSLEPWILGGIGGIVVLWANAEWRLTGVAAIVQEYGRKESRRKLNGRADDALAEIRYGLALAKIPEPALLSCIAARVGDLADLRNCVAHGVWLNDANLGLSHCNALPVSGMWRARPLQRRRYPNQCLCLLNGSRTKATQMLGFIEDTKRLERELRALIGE